MSQRGKKFKKVQAKKLAKSNKSHSFFVKLAILNFFPVQNIFLAMFEMAKIGIWLKKFVKLVYLISRVFLA